MKSKCRDGPKVKWGKRVSRAPGVPRWSPNQVLTRLE